MVGSLLGDSRVGIFRLEGLFEMSFVEALHDDDMIAFQSFEKALEVKRSLTVVLICLKYV